MVRKTIKKWFESIEDETIRKKTLRNMGLLLEGVAADSIPNALMQGFDWSESHEGLTYWARVYENEVKKLSNKEKLSQ